MCNEFTGIIEPEVEQNQTRNDAGRIALTLTRMDLEAQLTTLREKIDQIKQQIENRKSAGLSTLAVEDELRRTRNWKAAVERQIAQAGGVVW